MFRSKGVGSALGGYLLALAAVALATLGLLLFADVFARIPFALYFAAVSVTARYGGLGPALAASVVGVALADFLILPPRYSFALLSPEDGAMLVVLMLVAILISSVMASQRAAEATERRQREWLQTTLASIGDAVIATDGRGAVVFMNEVAQRLTGWPEAEAVGRPLAEVFQIFNEQTGAPAEDPVARVLRENAVVGLANHTIVRARDGSERPVDDSAAPIRGSDGAVAGVVLVFRDVAERRQAETARQQLVSLMESSGEFIGICDTSMMPIFVNEAGLRMVGLESLEQARRTPVLEFFYPEDRPYIMDDLFPRVARDGRGEVEIRFRHFRDQQPIWAIYSLVALTDEAGNRTGWGTVTRNITDRKRAEEALRESEERLRAVWESAADAMALSDPDGTVVAANPAYYRLLGREPEQVIGKSFALIFPPEQQAQAAAQYRSVFEAEELVPMFETIIERADGSQVAVEARYDFVMQDGRRTAMVSMVRDISDRRALERHQQEFLSIVGHELRNPLSSLRGYAQLMKRRQAYSERAVDVIVQQTDRLDRLIRDLTDMSRLEAGHLALEPVQLDLVNLVHACVEEARGQAEGHQIRVDGPDTPVVGTWDRDRLEQVITNLLSNALKYSPEGGNVVVRIEQRDGEAVVSVRDQGVGIQPAQLPFVFDRFYRVRETTATASGLGLGLYVCKYLIEAHGGRIWAESDGESQGSTFVFTLPLAPGAGDPPATVADARPASAES